MPRKSPSKTPAKTATKTAAKRSVKVAVRELKLPKESALLRKLIKQLNKTMTDSRFDALLSEMLPRGYRCVGAFDGDKILGVAGFWIGHRFWCRKYIDIDNVVVDEKLRSRGVGAKMLAWIEKEGKKQGCDMAMLDCYTTHHQSHRFYFREGYSILGYHFTKDL